MKNDISSLELYYLIKELKVLENTKIDRIYNPKNNPKELTIVCHISGEGKTLLKFLLPGIALLDDSKDASDIQTGFGMMLRKYLEGARLKLIEQKDFERVLTIVIESRSAGEVSMYYLIIEMFSKGNIIFCDDKLKILNTLEEQTWKDRVIKRNETYRYPKSRIDTLNVLEDGFKTALHDCAKESIVKGLAITFNLGGQYAEELCFLSGIDKSRDLKTLTDEDYSRLYKNLILLLHKEPSAIECEGNIYPFFMETCKDKEHKEYKSFSEAIRENYDIIKHIESKKDSNKNVEKIQNTLDEQMKVLEECTKGYEENQAKAEAIYEKYQEIDSILKTVKEARTKHSWAVIRQKLNDNPQFKKTIKDIDEKTSSIIIEIER